MQRISYEAQQTLAGMGLDLSSVPVRLDSAALRAMRDDPHRWELGVSHPPFGHPIGDPEPELARELMAAIPAALDWKWHYPDRSYHQAEYLLDPAGYRTLGSWPARERSLPYRIMMGDTMFAGHARGTQGVPWRCSGTAFLAAAAAQIAGLNTAAVREQFSVADMARHGVYKVHPGDDDREVFERVRDNLLQVGRYYREVAAHGLDLIFLLD